MRNDAQSFKNITSATTTQVKVGNGRLMGIVLNKPVTSSTITITDDNGSTSVALGVITNTSDVKPYFVMYGGNGLKFKNGLKIVTSGADNITVIYE